MRPFYSPFSEVSRTDGTTLWNIGLSVVSVVSCLWREAGQESLTVPLAVPLLSSTQLSGVLLQYGRHHRGMMGRLGGHRKEKVPLVLLHL